MPGPAVHMHMTTKWAVEEGLTELEAAIVADADIRTDALWPGNRIFWRHFNPTARLIFGPLELRRAIRAAAKGERRAALDHLGYSLHSMQDSVGHGLLGFNHLLFDAGVLGRNPDVWELMPPSTQAGIERLTRRTVRRFVEAERERVDGPQPRPRDDKGR